MAAVKLIVFLGLFAVALGYTLPEEQVDDYYSSYQGFGDESPFANDRIIIIRNPRSPQRVEANVEHSDRHGTSASVDYTHPISDNLEAYGGVARNFRYNDNSGHVGLRYNF